MEGRTQRDGRSSKVAQHFDARRVVLCSYGAAAAATMMSYPLDLIKARLQTYSYPTFWNCIKSCYAEGGVSAFYQGMTASILANSVSRSFNMSLYTYLRGKYANFLGCSSELQIIPIFLGGFTAGAMSCIVTGPFEFTKLASQLENLVYKSRDLPPPPRTGAIQAVRDLSRRGGFMRLYGGVEYHSLRDALGSGVYFSVYEKVKIGMTKLLDNKTEGPPHPLSVAVAGGLCGCASWIVVYPIDTMKSIYQRDLYNHSLATSLEARETWVERPPFRWSMSMYRGLGFSMLRTSINGIALFSFYEYFLYLTA